MPLYGWHDHKTTSKDSMYTHTFFSFLLDHVPLWWFNVNLCRVTNSSAASFTSICHCWLPSPPFLLPSPAADCYLCFHSRPCWLMSVAVQYWLLSLDFLLWSSLEFGMPPMHALVTFVKFSQSSDQWPIHGKDKGWSWVLFCFFPVLNFMFCLHLFHVIFLSGQATRMLGKYTRGQCYGVNRY